LLKDEIDDLRSEVERLRFTHLERATLSEARDDFEADGFSGLAAVIDGLLAKAASIT
jgi:hypothetical protein